MTPLRADRMLAAQQVRRYRRRVLPFRVEGLTHDELALALRARGVKVDPPQLEALERAEVGLEPDAARALIEIIDATPAALEALVVEPGG